MEISPKSAAHFFKWLVSKKQRQDWGSGGSGLNIFATGFQKKFFKNQFCNSPNRVVLDP